MQSSIKTVDVLVIGRNLLLTYEIPERYEADDLYGKLVVIPLRREKLLGCVIKRSEFTKFKKLQKIDYVISDDIFFSENLLKLANFISEYYGNTLSKTLEKIFPSGTYTSLKRIVILKNKIPEKICSRSKICSRLQSRKEVSQQRFLSVLKKENNEDLYLFLLDSGYIDINFILPPPLNPNLRRRICFIKNMENDNLTVQEKRILDLLILNNNEMEIQNLLEITDHRSLKILISLIRKKILGIKRLSDIQENYDFILTDEQESALEKINNSITYEKNEIFLLHGITGSGKTLVYQKAVEHCLDSNKKALLLIPEIGLTPQITDFFRSCFPDKKIGLFHSSLSPRVRFDTFRLASKGLLDIIIGTRSSIFLPLKDIGIIIVDEEHSQQYKEEESPPFYSARDIAVFRGKNESISVILGSATPSAESYVNAKSSKYSLLKLERRVNNAKLPQCRITVINPKLRSPITPPLVTALKRILNDGHQAILLMNRRGYSNFIICPSCGEVINCPHCRVAMTYHKTVEKLICHYCNHLKPIPDKCPKCNSKKLHLHGWGTEQVEKEFKRIFPEINLIRLDTDILKMKKRTHRDVFSEFHNVKSSVLLGTQMVAKGLDFPGVSLVGIIDADSSISFPDFRSAENTFQLIVQAAGRAGRASENGEVIIQTRNPNNKIISYAQNHDYESFINSELKMRKEAKYPPYVRLVRIIISSGDEKRARETSAEVKKILSKENKWEILGPSKAPLEKIKGKFRWHMLLKIPKSKIIGKEIYNLVNKKRWKNSKVFVDVDPQWML